MASYDQLLNSGGTIFNQGAKVAYSNADQLAADLGIASGAIQWGNIAKAGTDFNPTGYAGYTAPGAVSLNQMQPTVPITVPTPNYDATIGKANGLNENTASTNKTVQDYINSFTPPTTQTDTQYQDLLKSIAGLTAQDTGQQQYELQQQNQFQVPEIKQQISDLNSQILSGLAEQRKTQANYDAANLALEQQPQQLAGVVGSKQQELQRTYSIQQASKSADLGLLQARQSALGGQLNTALDLAARATELRYQPIEDALKVKQAQIQAIQPLLDKQEKIQAQALTAFYNDEQTRIAEEKAKAKENLNLALSLGVDNAYIQKPGGEIFRLADGYSFSSPEDFQAKTGITLDQANQKGLITPISNSTIQNTDLVAQLRAEYFDAGVNLSDTPEVARQKIQQNSRIYQEKVRPPASAGGGSSGGVLGLSNQQIDNISPLVSQFQNSQIVKDYSTIGETLTAVRQAGDTPTDDIQRIYAFAKIMDPGSVVREGEYKTVQDYATSLLQRTGLKANRVFNNDGFLTTEARDFLLGTLENRFKASEKNYQNIYNETARRINLIGNTDKGTQLLNNYGGAFAPTNSAPPGFVGPVSSNTPPEKIVTTPETKGWWDKTTNWLWGAD